MKKILTVFIFIFLAGLFSGVFYSTGLSAENTDRLSELILSASASPPSGFIHSLLSFFRVNMLMLLLMLPAVFTKYLCPVPPLLLWYRCFSAGFCSGIIYICDPWPRPDGVSGEDHSPEYILHTCIHHVCRSHFHILRLRNFHAKETESPFLRGL